jgi:hypothetical protein
VLGDVAVIHHVEQASRRREDLWFFMCWAFSQNLTQILGLVYLTLTDRPGDSRIDVPSTQCLEGTNLSGVDPY